MLEDSSNSLLFIPIEALSLRFVKTPRQRFAEVTSFAIVEG